MDRLRFLFQLKVLQAMSTTNYGRSATFYPRSPAFDQEEFNVMLSQPVRAALEAALRSALQERADIAFRRIKDRSSSLDEVNQRVEGGG